MLSLRNTFAQGPPTFVLFFFLIFFSIFSLRGKGSGRAGFCASPCGTKFICALGVIKPECYFVRTPKRNFLGAARGGGGANEISSALLVGL